MHALRSLRRSWGVGLLLFSVLACGAEEAPRRPIPAAGNDFYLGGIQVNEPTLDGWLDGLAAAGMNTVSVTHYARQGDWDSDNLFWEPDYEGVVREIRAAKVRGFRVVLILRVALDHAFPRNRFLWHGMIMPADDSLLANWFARYSAFALGWARTAEEEGVDVLMIASEMNALTSTLSLAALPALEAYYLDEEKQSERREQVLAHESTIEERDLWLRGREEYPSLEDYLEAESAAQRAWAKPAAAASPAAALAQLNARRAHLEQHWRDLIHCLRDAYHGQLGYAANFDQYQQVGFWDALDVIGINAYFSLRQRLLPEAEEEVLYAELERGWRLVFGEIDAFRSLHGLPSKPLIFTELGYLRRANATLQPWAHGDFTMVPTTEGETMLVWEDQPFRPQERALAVRALYAITNQGPGTDRLHGLLYWKLSTQPAHQAIEPYVLILGGDDPLLAALRRFRGPDGAEG